MKGTSGEGKIKMPTNYIWLPPPLSIQKRNTQTYGEPILFKKTRTPSTVGSRPGVTSYSTIRNYRRMLREVPSEIRQLDAYNGVLCFVFVFFGCYGWW